jgi:hypothetical protein
LAILRLSCFTNHHWIRYSIPSNNKSDFALQTWWTGNFKTAVTPKTLSF